MRGVPNIFGYAGAPPLRMWAVANPEKHAAATMCVTVPNFVALSQTMRALAGGSKLFGDSGASNI